MDGNIYLYIYIYIKEGDISLETELQMFHHHFSFKLPIHFLKGKSDDLSSFGDFFSINKSLQMIGYTQAIGY